MLTSLRKTWTWQSIRPGIRTLPFRLITWAVDDDSGRSDTSRTWPSSTNTSIFSRSSPFRGSSTRAALNKIDIKKFSDCSATKSAGLDYRTSSLEAGSVKTAYHLACAQRNEIGQE